MKSTFLRFLLPVLLTCPVGCNSVMMKLKGVTKPVIETNESTLYYLNNRMSGSCPYCFIAKDSARIMELYQMIGGFPAVNFFSKDGKLIKYSETGSCTGKANLFAARLDSVMKYQVDPKYLFSDIINRLTKISQKDSLSTDDYDFLLIVYWAKFAGRLNNNAFDVVKTVAKNRKISALIIYVDLDFQASWGIKKMPEVKGL